MWIPMEINSLGKKSVVRMEDRSHLGWMDGYKLIWLTTGNGRDTVKKQYIEI